MLLIKKKIYFNLEKIEFFFFFSFKNNFFYQYIELIIYYFNFKIYPRVKENVYKDHEESTIC